MKIVKKCEKISNFIDFVFQIINSNGRISLAPTASI